MQLRHLRWVLALLSACGARSGFEEFTTNAPDNGGAATDGVTAAGGSPSAGAGASARPAAGAPSAALPSGPYGCFAFSDTLIDDIEDRQVTKSLSPGLQLTWSGSVTLGMAIKFGAAQLAPPRGSSRFAMHGGTPGTGLIVEFRLSPCVDVGSARGISFWARGNKPLLTRANLSTLASMSVLDGGLCSTTCAYPGVGISITAEWQQFEIVFGSLEPVEPPPDYRNLTAFQLFAGASDGPVELWFDDPQFMR